MRKAILLLIVGLHMVSSPTVLGQQNLTMYQVEANAQVNTLNPAFQIPCNIFVGLPLISSIHSHLGWNLFSYRDLFPHQGANTIKASNLHLGQKNVANFEEYLEWLNVGFWKGETYLNFSITEKIDMAGIVRSDVIRLLIDGNSQFEGEIMSANRSGLFFDYRREYALGLSRKINNKTTLGVKAKLLFGKLNFLTRKSKIEIQTDEQTFDLSAMANIRIKSSAPVTFILGEDGLPENISTTGTPVSFLLNRKNPGLAIDLGFIYQHNEKETYSASILDLGGILYRSGVNNYDASGEYTFTGQLSNVSDINFFFNDLLSASFSEYQTSLNHTSYFSFLPTRIYGAYQRQLTPKATANVLATSKFYRYKMITAVGLGAQYQILEKLSIATSWTYAYHTYKNVGAGIVAGRGLQFYLFTDNVLAFALPLWARQANLRFGFNLNFGCRVKRTKQAERTSNCGCKGLDDEEAKQLKYELRRQKQN